MKKSNIVKVVSIIVFSIIISVLVLSLNNKNNYLDFEYKVETITKVDNDLHITFYDDETQEQEESGKNIVYTIYGHQVDLTLLDHIKEGDIVKITVEDNYGKFIYTIIYEMQYQNNVIFNIIEEYSVLEHNNKIVFISFFSSMLLYVVFLCFYKGKEEDNTISDFEILRPNWEKIFFIGNIFGGIGFIIPFSILYLLKMCDVEYFKFSFVFYIFVILGIFGIYVSSREKFVYKNETFTYHRVFGKQKNVLISEVKYILIIPPKHSRGIAKIEFYNYDNKKLMWFGLDFNIFKDDLLEKVCKKYSIDIKLCHLNLKKQRLRKGNNKL